jgi:hypothetical protein
VVVPSRVVLMLLPLIALAVARSASSSPTPADATAERHSWDDVPSAEMVRTDVPPEIDGRLDEPVWSLATVIDDFRQVEPVEGAEPSERTEVRLLYDADFLYVAFRCYDREPQKIIATQMQRDRSLGPDDRINFFYIFR